MSTNWTETELYKKAVTKDRADALAEIREEALLAFFKRFSRSKPNAASKMKNRKARRYITRWLDKKDIRIKEMENHEDFLVIMPSQSTGMLTTIEWDSDKMWFEYRFTLVDKRTLEPLEDK